MIKTSILRYGAIGIATLGLGLGVAAADSATLGGTTGPHSNNQVSTTNENNAHALNVNGVGVNNVALQGAGSGNADASGNTTAGDAVTGDATASNSAVTTLTVTNDSSLGTGLGVGDSDNAATLDATTGPNSNNQVNVDNEDNSQTTNVNLVGVTNFTGQDVSTGSAKVNGNTTGGSAISGAATASSSSDTTVTLSN